MNRTISQFALVLLIVVFVVVPCCGQGGGAGAGSHATRPALSQANLGGTGPITVSGTARIAVEPESLRLVLAISTVGETADECSENTKSILSTIREELVAMNLRDQDVV